MIQLISLTFRRFINKYGLFYNLITAKKLFILLLLIPSTLNIIAVKVKPFKFNNHIKNHITEVLVTLTTYSTCINQTDSTPYITASGFKLDSINPKRHKIIAISRNLKSKFKFRNKVRIVGAGKYDGIYRIEDVMNKRYVNRIDILINPNDRGIKLNNVKLVKI
jgi:3D (Asp-Asp-Asp) domain-containing protein